MRNDKLASFMARDFASEANRTAALKNGCEGMRAPLRHASTPVFC